MKKHLLIIFVIAIITSIIGVQITTNALDSVIQEGNQLTQELKDLYSDRDSLNKEITEKERLRSDLEAKAKEMVSKSIFDKKTPEIASKEGNFKLSEGGIDNFLKVNGAEFVSAKGRLFNAVGVIYRINPELLVCIAQADSSLGNALKSKNNIGNVGNNDRGSVVHYDTLEDGIKAIGATLNNQYLKGNTTLGQLSQGGREIAGAKNDCANSASPYKCYATSKFNWNNNVKLCLRNILQDDSIDETFNFRIND